MSTAPKVAVVGGGLAGAACTSALIKRGADVTVFDMGRQSPGGRASTRVMPGQQYDYGCQFFRASTPAMKQLVTQWTSAGAVAEWRPRLGLYDVASGAFKAREQLSQEELQATQRGYFGSLEPEASGGPLYVGQPSMAALVAHLLQGGRQEGGADASRPGGVCTVRLNQRVQRARFAEGRWVLGGGERLMASGAGGEPSGSQWDPLGSYDALVLTDSQVGRPGSPGYIAFEAAPPQLSGLAARLADLTRVPLFSLMVGWATGPPAAEAEGAEAGAGARPPALPADALVVAGGAAIKWLAVDSSKPGRRRERGGMECWVAVTTPEFAAQLMAEDAGLSPPAATAEYRAHKAERIWAALQADLAGCLGGATLPRPAHLSAHRWSSALMSTPLGLPAAWEDSGRWAACGDFCGGPGVESAVTSGLAAAEAVAGMLGLQAAPAATGAGMG